MTDNVINFAEAGARIRAEKLRKEDSHLGRVFRNLESGPEMAGVTTEQLLRWADRLNNAKDSDTIEDICRDVEKILGESKANV